MKPLNNTEISKLTWKQFKALFPYVIIDRLWGATKVIYITVDGANIISPPIFKN